MHLALPRAITESYYLIWVNLIIHYEWWNMSLKQNNWGSEWQKSEEAQYVKEAQSGKNC